MVGDEDQSVVVEARIERVQHRTDARNAVEQLEMVVGVPGERGDAIAFADAEREEGPRQALAAQVGRGIVWRWSPPSSVRATISMSPWAAAACSMKPDTSSGASIIRPRIHPTSLDRHRWRRSHFFMLPVRQAVALSRRRRYISPLSHTSRMSGFYHWNAMLLGCVVPMFRILGLAPPRAAARGIGGRRQRRITGNHLEADLLPPRRHQVLRLHIAPEDVAPQAEKSVEPRFVLLP